MSARTPQSRLKVRAHFGVLFLFLGALASCNPTELQPSGIRTAPNSVNNNLLGKAYVYEDDPVNATGKSNLAPSFNIKKILTATKQITPASKTSLTNDCMFQYEQYFFVEQASFTDCLRVLANDSASTVPLQPNNGNWIYEPGSVEFYQVQAMYHANKMVTRMMDVMQFSHEKLHLNGTKSLPPSMPYDLESMGTWWFKYLAGQSQMSSTAQLTVYSTVTTPALKNNAYYDPTKNAIQLGWTAYPGYTSGSPLHVLMVQDPSVIYHEMGHAFMTIFLNMRNATFDGLDWQPLKYQAFPYSGSYSELGAIGEGVADYFSYAMTARPSLGDWAFGRFVSGRRPMNEDHPLHAPGISSNEDERLSYPDYLMYEPSQPQFPIEDVHNGGMFASHYLVALTDSLKSECFWDHDTAVNHVMMTLAESFSYLGDLSARGTDYNNTDDGTGTSTPKSLVNLHPKGSYDWYYSVKQITARRFAQVMARNLYHHISLDACVNFTKEKSERLLDMYGLLLFKHYDDNGTFSASVSAAATRKDAYAQASPTGLFNAMISGIGASVFGMNYPNTISGTTAAPTTVDEINRVKSVVIPKASLDFKTEGAFATLFLDDSAEFGQSVAASTLFQGRIISPSTGLAGPEYNNHNNRISPGEIVGLGLDLENRSNTPIGGVAILATPWAHMKVTNTATGKAKPCTINGFPSLSEGGLSATDCANSLVQPTDGARFKKPTSGAWPAKALHPVCVVQSRSNNETRWISQDEYRTSNIQLPDNRCLGYGTPDFAPAECLIRFVPGREVAFLGKIDPQKSYLKTLSDAYTTYNASVPVGQRIPAPSPASSSVLLLEVNKWTPPGTTFTCRLRAQFSNCSDCFESAAGQDEYTDIEYSGAAPFKVLDVSFTVID